MLLLNAQALKKWLRNNAIPLHQVGIAEESISAMPSHSVFFTSVSSRVTVQRLRVSFLPDFRVTS